MGLKKIQKEVDVWIKKYGVRYFDPLTNMAQLSEEVGEVARIISRRYGEQSEKDSDKNKNLAEELSDVLFVVLCIANQTNCDLEKAFKNKLILKTKRDQKRHLNNPKLKNKK
jgi:NTP pyrophosphatase (non-canonical NTP hydrolase)|tara:strand:+ start:346 stop:681 length:336 start_codon:yes stop_codon:yes gene_type:complete